MSIFTRIIDGELPGEFVWADDTVVGLMTIAPQNPGHVLVIPRTEIDHWTDLPAPVRDRVFEVAQRIGAVVGTTFPCARVGLSIAGFEVPHAHIHVFPADGIGDMDQTRAMQAYPADRIAADAEAIRRALREAGNITHVPGPGPLPA